LEWIAISLGVSAILVLVRYGSRPRCPLCARRHDPRTTDQPDVVNPLPSAADRTTIRWRAAAPSSLKQPDVASLN
jgi:hypothetical protein